MASDVSPTKHTRAAAVVDASHRVAITDWRPGAPGASAAATDTREGVRWIDVSVGVPVQDVLTPCRQAGIVEIDDDLVHDLMTRGEDERADIIPQGETVRHVSAFLADAADTRLGLAQRSSSRAGVLVVRPVEFLAGESWLVTCWHDPVAFRGARSVPDAPAPRRLRSDVRAAVGRRWCDGEFRSAGDLACLILHELAITYAPARRQMESWLEHWELELYQAERSERDTLEDVWGNVAVFREWLAPLNPPGMSDDIGKAWFSGITQRHEVKAIDGRVDRALDGLRNLAKTLRASFGTVHSDQQRRRTERLELIATAALVPTFIASFYGANTDLPGKEHWTGFWQMVLMMVCATALAIVLLQRSQRRSAEGRSSRSRGDSAS